MPRKGRICKRLDEITRTMKRQVKYSYKGLNSNVKYQEWYKIKTTISRSSRRRRKPRSSQFKLTPRRQGKGKQVRTRAVTRAGPRQRKIKYTGSSCTCRKSGAGFSGEFTTVRKIPQGPARPVPGQWPPPPPPPQHPV